MGICSVVLASQSPYIYSANISITTAGTGVIISSTTGGAMYITDIITSNGATAGNIGYGYGTGTATPTGAALLIQPIFLGASSNSHIINMGTPFKIPSGNNFLFVSVSSTTVNMTVSYYVAV